MIEVVGVDEKEVDRLNALALHALSCAATWGVLPPRMTTPPKAFVVYPNSGDLGEALGLPERVSGGRVVARCDPVSGIIYLSEGDGLTDRTVFYECGRWIFQDRSGMETGSENMERFADYCLRT